MPGFVSTGSDCRRAAPQSRPTRCGSPILRGTLSKSPTQANAACRGQKLLHTLQAAPTLTEARSVDGSPYAYASVVLGEGYRLIVATPARADREAATALLIRRIGQLFLLLLIGLAGVAIGTHLALVEPLTRLSRAVARWRLDGRFDATSLRDPPTEVAAMAATFAEATQSVTDHAARHRTAVAQQELLMREIHHRVKNNLQIVASLLNLQAVAHPPAGSARRIRQRTRQGARSGHAAPPSLSARRNPHDRHARLSQAELCGQLFEAMGEVRPAGVSRSNIEAGPLQMDERSGRASVAYRDRGGEQRPEIRVSKRPRRHR